MTEALPEWPLFVFGGLLTVMAAGVFVAIFVAARSERDDRPS
jgi:hypothetical protein